MNSSRNRKTLYAVTAGLLSSAVFLALAVRQIDLHELGQALLRSQWWPWYVIAPLVYLTGHFVRGLRCKLILRPHCDLSVWTSTNIVVIGYGANNFLPARMGEFVRAYVLSRNAPVSVSLSLATTFLERLLDGLAITAVLVVAGFFAPLPAWGTHLIWVALAIFLSASAAAVLLTVARPLVLRIAGRITAVLPVRIGGRLLDMVHRAMASTDCLRDPKLLAGILGLSLVAWTIETAMFLTVLPAFGLPASPVRAGLAMSVTNLGILVPSSPGYIGAYHYFCMQAIRIFDVPQETALGYAIVTHLLYYIPITLWGALALAAYGVDLQAATRTAESVEEAAPEDDVTAQETAL